MALRLSKHKKDSVLHHQKTVRISGSTLRMAVRLVFTQYVETS